MRNALFVVVLGVFGVVGCGGGNASPPPDAAPPEIDAAVVPVFRNAVALPDAELAMKSLQILGADVAGTTGESCNGCHGVTKQKLRYWRALSDTSMTSCLTDLSVTSQANALQMISCIREMPTIETSDFKTKNLGIYATAAKLPWFDYVFKVAYPADSAAKLAQFQSEVGMPKEGIASMTQEQFDIVAEWYARGLPGLDETLVTDPAPETCEAGVSADVGAHVAAMSTTSWRVKDKMAMMSMHGCGTETDPRNCLQDYPLGTAQPYGTSWDAPNRGHLRVLADNTYVSSYWTRSSPDGRFVAHGVSNVAGSYVIDLQRNVTVPIDVLYDPAFFPDNSGFVFQGGPRNTCAMSVLTSNPTSITMNEPGCRKITNIGLYQHVGQGVGGGADYFALDNEFESDDGGKVPTHGDPATSFGSRAYSSFTAMIFNGTQYQVKSTVNIDTPFEGDTVLSPSAELTMSRVSGPNDKQLGYVLRKVTATPTGNSYTYAAPEIARYCFSGSKVAFSFDERWIAYHHYVTAADAVEMGFTGPTDPGFAPYLQLGAANLYLMELTTGVRVRLTNMAPGQYALYPHFRADNWIYAQVRDDNLHHEYTVATDAALLLE